MSVPNGHSSPGRRSHFDRPDWRKCTEQPDCGCRVCLDKAGISLPEAREPDERGEQKQTDKSLVAELARLSPFEYDRKRKDTGLRSRRSTRRSPSSAATLMRRTQTYPIGTSSHGRKPSPATGFSTIWPPSSVGTSSYRSTRPMR
jgi:hypothetical protein